MTQKAEETTILAPTRAGSTGAVKRAAWGGYVGTALEQYDFTIYGLASALIFSQVFFPSISPAAGVLASFGAYAVGFAARPLGGLFFSRHGDRLGRKWILVATLLLMGGATFLIGILPTFEQVGVLAPLLLVTLRFLQGFGAGAEQSGAATLLTETARPGKRGLLASLVMTGSATGAALGAAAWIAVQQLPHDALMAWGWRLIFLSSLFITIFALVLRRRLNESPVFVDLKAKHHEPKRPLLEVLSNGKRPVLAVTGMLIGVSSQSYTYQVFFAAYLVNNVGLPASTVTFILLMGAVCGALFTTVFGRMSDRFGRRSVASVILGAMVILPAPGFFAISTGSVAAAWITVILGFVLAAYGVVAVQMSYFPELFGNRYRYAGVTMGRELASILGGGVAPLICAGLVGAFAGSWVPVAGYMSAMALISLISTRLSPETLNRRLDTPNNATDRSSAISGA